MYHTKSHYEHAVHTKIHYTAAAMLIIRVMLPRHTGYYCHAILLPYHTDVTPFNKMPFYAMLLLSNTPEDSQSWGKLL